MSSEKLSESANESEDLYNESERWEAASDEDAAQIEMSLIRSIAHAISARFGFVELIIVKP